MPSVFLPRSICLSKTWKWQFICTLALVGAVLVFSMPEAFAQFLMTPGAKPPQASPPSGVMAWLLSLQADFSQQLIAAVKSIKEGQGFWPLLTIAFLYGVFHAAGPGHGKSVVASYVMANERVLPRVLFVSSMAALLQAFMALLIVGVLHLVFQTSAATMNRATYFIELVSFALIMLIGASLMWRKGRALFGQGDDHHHDHAHSHAPHDHAHHDHHHHDHAHHDHVHHDHDHAAGAHCDHCGHAHLPDAKTLATSSTRDMLSAIVAAGLRPCSGAILLLVFAISQGLWFAGVAGVFAMAIGTAITTGALATMAVLAKSGAQKLTDTSERFSKLIAWLEFLAAVALFLMGLLLLIGFMHGGG